MPDFHRSRAVWHGHIARWGGGENNGVIMRGPTGRTMTMAMSRYTPQERAKLAIDGVVRFMISALVLDGGAYVMASDEQVPDPELDYIVFKGKEYKIAMKPEGAQPDGTWIAFDTPCVLIGKVDTEVS